jgi:hypothetical protein
MKKPIGTPINVDIIHEIEKQLELDIDAGWRLVRQADNLTKTSEQVMWIEWNEDGSFKSKHEQPAVGRSLLMSPFNQYFTWQTTPITVLHEVTDDCVKFDTGNSEYELVRF